MHPQDHTPPPPPPPAAPPDLRSGSKKCVPAGYAALSLTKSPPPPPPGRPQTFVQAGLEMLASAGYAALSITMISTVWQADCGGVLSRTLEVQSTADVAC